MSTAENIRYYGKAFKSLPLPDLMETQRKFYAEFLQSDVAPDMRKNDGLEAVLREIFPVESYDGSMKMEYLGYQLQPPRYSPDECRQLKQTYGAPLRMHIRLTSRQGAKVIDEWVYVGEMPLMIGGGEFIINGAERVIVTQIQRSPGVDFATEVHSSGKTLYSARIIPERGSWITVETTAKDELVVKIDRSGKIAATMFIRALAVEEIKNPDGTVKETKLLLDTDADVIRSFYPTEMVPLNATTIAELTADDQKLPVLVSQVTEYNEELKQNEIKFHSNIPLDEKVGKALLHYFEGKTDDQGNPLAVEIEILRQENIKDPLILNTLGTTEKRFDESRSHQEAILWLFKKLRPGNVINQSKAWEVFHDRFFDPIRYSFGEIGRFRINRKFGDDVGDLTFTAHDFYNVCNYILQLRAGTGVIDDIDHLENRRLRTIKDLVTTELRAALSKWRRSIKEQMAIKREEEVFPHQLINVPTLTAAIDFFFARGELSQVVDQSNPLSQIVHERRLSALGPNGLNRKRAGFEVRDVHTSHYGRICPIETPEGANIGLIVSLATYAKINDMGFLITPYLLVKNKKIITEPVLAPEEGKVISINRERGEIVIGAKTVKLPVVHGFSEEKQEKSDPITQEIIVKENQKVKAGDPLTAVTAYLRADQEKTHFIGQSDIKVDAKGAILPERPQCRHHEDFTTCEAEQLSLLDVAPKQMVGVSAALIPFLEHDDTSRALMGSNMQRQAVPLVRPDRPTVSTGMEELVARNTGMVQRAVEDAEVTYADCLQIRTTSRELTEGERVYHLHKYKGLNDGTTLNQQPIVRVGDKVKIGAPLTDGAATRGDALALGINTRVAFISWEGCNFEDAILVSEKMIVRDAFTSVHIEEFQCEIRETKVGTEEITRDIPGVSEAALASLDAEGLAYIGTKVKPGDILVGKIAPKAKTEFSSEEKLLRAIFGRAGEDVKNDSLTVPPGTEGYVIKVKRFSRKRPHTETAAKDQKKRIAEMEIETKNKISLEIKKKFDRLKELLGGYPVKKSTGKEVRVPGGKVPDYDRMIELQDEARLGDLEFPAAKREKATRICIEHDRRIEFLRVRMDVEVGRMKRGDDLKPGILELVKVYVAVKRKLSVGDKMAGRHGNKGVVSRILPEEDMPFLADGTPMEMILNPLGIPSRMNVGQILEVHLGWAANKLGFRAVTPVFEGATEKEVVEALQEAALAPDGHLEDGTPLVGEDGKANLYDGRTGEKFHETVTVGYMYMLKLHHLVADKIHARATGPYSLITQQPLGGKARNGGQRFGEMEVWAIEAYGAAHILQELLTVKSDDVDGRTKVYEAMVKGECSVEPGLPVSFDVLCNEIRGIGINLRMEKAGSLAAPVAEA
ncbi:MAG: DNA-directed RNA polymerase subunit beta [Planctomycetota bacterium]|jgi:DNA-directed RNA polymerase subunit beta|nr:DNA-directed RNA polymerase subunit beta [Planctomycetota bacterium]